MPTELAFDEDLARRLPLPLAQLYRAGGGADALGHLHRQDIIPHDIKPANVLVLDGGALRLSDFGLVKKMHPVGTGKDGESVGPGSTQGAVMGTRDYMAPEQEHGGAVGKQADVYSLGIVLAELATGHRPRRDRTTVAGSPIEKDDRVERLPEPLRRLIFECTDLDPGRRPSDARFVLNEFEHVAANLPPPAQPSAGAAGAGAPPPSANG